MDQAVYATQIDEGAEVNQVDDFALHGGAGVQLFQAEQASFLTGCPARKDQPATALINLDDFDHQGVADHLFLLIPQFVPAAVTAQIRDVGVGDEAAQSAEADDDAALVLADDFQLAGFTGIKHLLCLLPVLLLQTAADRNEQIAADFGGAQHVNGQLVAR